MSASLVCCRVPSRRSLLGLDLCGSVAVGQTGRLYLMENKLINQTHTHLPNVTHLRPTRGMHRATRTSLIHATHARSVFSHALVFCYHLRLSFSLSLSVYLSLIYVFPFSLYLSRQAACARDKSNRARVIDTSKSVGEREPRVRETKTSETIPANTGRYPYSIPTQTNR